MMASSRVYSEDAARNRVLAAKSGDLATRSRWRPARRSHVVEGWLMVGLGFADLRTFEKTNVAVLKLGVCNADVVECVEFHGGQH